MSEPSASRHLPEAWAEHLMQARSARAGAGLARSLREARPLPGGRIRLGDLEAINYASNDYLGLATEPELLSPWLRDLREPYGSGASRLITGTQPIHTRLEARLAETRGCESALTLPTGYQANVAAITALADADTTIYSDALNHASLIDGCRLSRARVRVFPHLDYDALAAMIEQDKASRAMIVSDSLFSMDGDVAGLDALATIAERFGALLVVDDAHGFGAIGERHGALESEGFDPSRVHVITGTFSKALGSLGGYICGTKALIEHCLNTARPFIFSTAASPMQAAVNLAALEWIQGAEAARRRVHLASCARALRAGIAALGFETGGDAHIVPLWLDAPMRAIELSQAMLAQGVLVPGIRPPTIPAGRGMLRFSLNAGIRADDVQRTLEVLAKQR